MRLDAHDRTAGPKLTLCLFLAILPAARGSSAAEFEITRSIRLPSFAKTQLGASPLDAEVYADTRLDFGDLRLLDGSDQAVPYLLRKSKSMKSAAVRPGELQVTYPVANTQVVQEQGQTVILLETAREPLTAFVLITSAENFSRAAIVEAALNRDPRNTWRRLAQQTLTRIDYQELQREKLAIAFSEARHRSYRVVIENHDSPPLPIIDVLAQGNVYELLFFADPGKFYRQEYGSNRIEPPAYDTTAIEQVLAEGYQPRQAQLAASARRSGDRSRSFATQLIHHRPLLVAGLALLIVLLAAGLYQATQRVERLPKE